MSSAVGEYRGIQAHPGEIHSTDYKDKIHRLKMYAAGVTVVGLGAIGAGVFTILRYNHYQSIKDYWVNKAMQDISAQDWSDASIDIELEALNNHISSPYGIGAIVCGVTLLVSLCALSRLYCTKRSLAKSTEAMPLMPNQNV